MCAMTGIDAARLSRMSLAELEGLYVQPQEVALPASGTYRGSYLGSIDSGAVPFVFGRPLQLMFELPPWKIHVDGARGHWSFFHDGLALGAMDLKLGQSRWRPTQTVQLTYQPSRLPLPIKWLLYDELKPLSADLCLGLGGINHPRPGAGELFFFSLVRE